MICAFVGLAAFAANAQKHISCIPQQSETGTRAIGRYSLPEPRTDWNPNRTYRQPVVLVTFKDREFSMPDPVTYYNRLFNESGYNEGQGLGCVSDYFRDQSGGLLNMHFDIYGPVRINTAMQQPDANEDSFRAQVVRSAMAALCDTCQADFSIYDWDNDNRVDQVVLITAGYCGNGATGCIWPGSCSDNFMTPGGKRIYMWSVSAELWNDEKGKTGIGTIVHEFAHCLGIPDLYPTDSGAISAEGFSVVDDWDLMDGGNYLDWGWCPPNFSAMEKKLLGWGNLVELTEATSISGMKPVSEGGTTYLIRNSGAEDEFYLLENRRQAGWDYAVPGNGLLISHVDFDRATWFNNHVNTRRNHRRYDFFHPDGKEYKDWDPDENCLDMSRYTMDHRMRSTYLSTTTYPYTNPETNIVKQSLTDDTDPAAWLFNANAQSKYFMSKPVTNIHLSTDGTISFDFMKVDTGIDAIINHQKKDDLWYDLQGRRLYTEPTRKGLYIHNGQLVSKH